MTEATEVAFFSSFSWGVHLKSAHERARARARVCVCVCVCARARGRGCMLMNKKHHSDVLEKTGS